MADSVFLCEFWLVYSLDMRDGAVLCSRLLVCEGVFYGK
jgi:hypothetical protein